MKTEEQFFKEAKEQERRESAERKVKWRNEITDEISGWMFHKLREEYIKLRLARIRHYNPVPAGMIWDLFKEECRFCDLEYVDGHETCCDNCWEENKEKTLAELE